MHEVGIANSILEAVQAEIGLHPGKVPLKIAVRIGEFAAIDPEALHFCFEALTRDTQWEALRLDIEVCQARYFCPECTFDFSIPQFDPRCPKCGNEHTQFLSGDQLELVYLEMEEHEPTTT